MPIYLLTPLGDNTDALRAAVDSKIPEADRFELQSRRGWFISYEGTTVELSNLIGITSTKEGFVPSLGSAMVTSVSSYYGRGQTSMWEWLKTRIERQR